MRTTEQHLWRSAADGDGEAVAVLYRRWAPSIRELALAIVRDVDDAEDVVQETFCALLVAMRSGHGPRTSAAGYIYRAAGHIAHRQWARSQPLVAIGLPVREPADHDGDRSEELCAVATAFAGLPRRWRDVLWLIEVDGYCPVDLAPAMAMTPNAVSSLATRARGGLRKAYWNHARDRTRGP